MGIRVLEYFIAVVDEGNITAAAEKLHITQPTLSRQLRELEEDLGKSLFLRGNKHITLTSYGELVYQRASEMIAISDKLLAELKTDSFDYSGDITIGCSDYQSSKFISKIIEKVRNNYPKITINLVSGNSSRLMTELEEDAVDFMVILGGVEQKKYEFVNLPYRDQLGLLCKNRNDLPLETQIKFEDLTTNSFELLLPNEISFLNILNYYFDVASLSVAGKFDNLLNVAPMLEHSIGVAIINSGSYFLGSSQLQFIPFEPRIYLEPKLIWKRNKIIDKKIEVFLDCIYESVSIDYKGSCY
ncbi:LysR family transcriptional regulator [Streptococcus merionis]|uniref:LysR family transcriptional regulator n=1 Tax=Streptococcus merionis TaxID=400065 RepID=UPI003515BB93